MEKSYLLQDPKDNDTYVLSVGADFAKFNLDIIK